jgi:ArsR family transcriptional regulator
MAKALGHPARVAILRTLAQRACVCGQIVDVLPLAQSTVSQHLKILKEAGWITGVIDGPRTCYALNREAIDELCLVLDPLLEQWKGAVDCPVESGCT